MVCNSKEETHKNFWYLVGVGMGWVGLGRVG